MAAASHAIRRKTRNKVYHLVSDVQRGQSIQQFYFMSVEQFLCREVVQPINNISSHYLDPCLIYTLSRGLDFIPTPTKKDTTCKKNLCDSVNIFTRRAKLAYFFRDKADDTNFVKKFHIPSGKEWSPPLHAKAKQVFDFMNSTLTSVIQNTSYPEKRLRHNNLSQFQISLLKEFRALPIICQDADKNLKLTIMDKTWYINTCLSHLQDIKTYTPCLQPKRIILSITLAKTRRAITQLINHNKLSLNIVKFLEANKSRTVESFSFCKFKGLPKIAKLDENQDSLHYKLSNLKVRPISSNSNYPTSALSQVIDHLLQPLVRQIPSFIKNTTDFIIKLDTVIIPVNQPVCIFAFDIASLYPNIPIVEAITTIEQSLFEQLPDPNDRLWLKAILEAMLFVLLNTYVEFNDLIFQQICGTAMGTSLAVAFACLYVAALEFKWQRNPKLIFYSRFIDDGCGIYAGTIAETTAFLKEFDSIHPNIRITSSVSTTSVDFLDLTIYRSPNSSKFQTKVFQKAMNKYLYLPFSSYHTTHSKSGFIRGELLRYIRNTSEKSFFLAISRQFFNRLILRGYSPIFLKPIFDAVDYSIRPTLLSVAHKIKPPRPIVFSTERNFLADFLQIPAIINKIWSAARIQVIHTDPEFAQWFERNPPIVAYRYPPSFRHILVRTDVNSFSKRILPVSVAQPLLHQ